MAVELKPGAVAKLKPSKTGAVTVTDTLATGLGLTVHPSGRKTWSVRYRMGRRLRRLTIGRYPAISLADARGHAREALKQVARNVDPAAEKIERREADTIGELAAQYLVHAETRKRSWKDDRRRLTSHILPVWKHRLARDITRRDVRELLDALRSDTPIEANRLRALLHTFFAFAIARDIVDVNPVTGVERETEQPRDRVLTHEEIRHMWKRFDALDPAMSAFYKLRLLTAQRGGEVASMRWQDLDLAASWWTVPSTRSKNKLPHRVPLNPSALAILKRLRASVDHDLKARRKAGKEVTDPIYVLEGARGKRQQAEGAATFGVADFRGHDLRRTAASLMAGSGVDRLVIGKILNHVEKGITAVYDRHSYDGEKRAALDQWSRTLAGILDPKKSGAVVSFAKRKRQHA